MLHAIKVALTNLYLTKKAVEREGKVNISGSLPRITNDGSMAIGDHVTLRGNSGRIHLKSTRNGRLHIEKGSLINFGTRIYSDASVYIGENCLIAEDCRIFDTNFHAVDEGAAVRRKGIRLERNVWLGRGVHVLPGVTIGEHSVVSAGSVVTHDLPARCVARGNPAEKVRDVRCSDAFRRE